MRQTLILYAFALLPFLGHAQTDTIAGSVELKEVFIAGTQVRLDRETKGNQENQQATIDRLMEQMSGVALIRRGNFAYEPTVRGLNAAQINLSIDGMAMFGACTDRMDPISSYVEPNNLRAVTANFSADGQSFGSSIGGGVNFSLQQPQLNAERAWSGRVGAGYESNGNAMQSMASLTHSRERLAINLNGVFRKSGNYRAGGREEIRFSQYEKWNAGLAVKYQVAARHLLTAHYIQDEGYDIGYPALTMDVSFAKAKIASLTHLFTGKGAWEKWETKAYWNFIDHAMDDTKRPKEMVWMHMDMPGQSKTIGLYSEAVVRLGEHNHLQFRLDAYQNQLHSEMTMYPEQGSQMFMLTLPDGQRSVFGFNASSHQMISSRLSVYFGVRGEVNHSTLSSDLGQRTWSAFSGKATDLLHPVVNLYVNPKIRVSEEVELLAHIALGMRPPSLKELYGFYLFDRSDGYDYLGNPALRNETSWNASLNGRWAKKRVQLEARLYAYFFDGYIAGVHEGDYQVMTPFAKGVKVYQNLSDARLFGLELKTEFALLAGLSLRGNHSLAYGYDFAGRALPMIPPLQSIDELRYDWKKYQVGLRARLAWSQRHVDEAMYGESPTPAFSVFDLCVRRHFAFGRYDVQLNMELTNMFDAFYSEHLDVMKIPRQGRSLVVQATMQF